LNNLLLSSAKQAAEIDAMTQPSSEKLEQLKLMLDRRHTEDGTPDEPLLERVQKWILHFNVEHVHGPEEMPYAKDELVLLCLGRDGRQYVKSFVEHHFSLGIKHIFFLDNGSTDGTVEALKEYDNVTVLRSTLPFKEYQLSMRQYLIERFAKKGRWCLYADIDELFDYPYSDVVGLGSLLRYLNESSYTAVVAQMLDMFPEEPLSDRVGELLDEPLKERHRFYDISNVQTKGIKEHRLTSNSTYESEDIEFFSGGIRNTVFGTKAYLTRFALVFSDGKVKPFAGSGHRVDNARVADLTGVLLHYKFLDGYFHKKAASAVREEQHWNISSYKKYLEALESNLSLQLKGEDARELRSVNDLVENQFLVVSEEYMMLSTEPCLSSKGSVSTSPAAPVAPRRPSRAVPKTTRRGFYSTE
jgi:hypothetical protein